MPKGNGAYIVHAELNDTLPMYQLRGCNPYLAAIPGLRHPALRRWLAEADIVHLPADCGHIPLSADCLRVITFHNFYTDTANKAHSSILQRLFYQQVLSRSIAAATSKAHRIVVVSRFLADCVRRHGLAGKTPIEIIHNGIDTQRFQPAPQDKDRPLRILFVGNPSRRKGFHLLSNLAAHLPRHVELAFTTGLRDEQVKTIHPKLVSLGLVPYAEMHHLYQQADILFFPSYREGFGLCIAEAMACGLPIVSTDCSAIPELIAHGKGGYLVEPGDFPSMLKYIQQLLQNSELRQTMGEYNRDQAVRYFDRTRMVDAYLSLFRSLLYKV